jgi:resuscitation-promoting factor RpfB
MPLLPDHLPLHDPLGPTVESGARRRPLTTLVLSAVVLPLVGFPPSVLLDVDGSTTVARAHVTTVAEAVEAAGVVLWDGDMVLPALDTAVREGVDVSIARAVDVTVITNGTTLAVRTADAHVGGVLRAAGLTASLSPTAVVSPSWSTPVRDGDVIELSQPYIMTVLDPAAEVGPRSHSTTAATVRGALAEAGVVLTPLDRVSPALDAPISRSLTVQIARVTLSEEQVEVRVPRERTRVDDATLLSGLVRVRTAGSDGLRVDRVLVTRVDGAEESRLVLESTLVRAPVSRVERVGTRVTPGDSIWDALARCESGSRWDAVRRVSASLSYHGGLQFHTRTWDAYRPGDFPALASQATREQQILVAERVQARQGWGAWPACARRLGLR